MPDRSPSPPPKPSAPEGGRASSPVPRSAAVVFGAGLLGGGLGAALSHGSVGVALALSTAGASLAVALVAAQLAAEQSRATRAKIAEMERRSASVQQRERAFVARLTQEFRTPLTLILAGFRALQEPEERDTAERRGLAAAGLRNSARLLLILHELGVLARMEPDSASPRRRTVDLADLVRRVASNVGDSGASRPIAVEGVDRSLPAEVDPHQIQTVLYALLSAAVQHAEPGGTPARVALESDGAWVTVRVTDPGVGPWTAARASAFAWAERFSRGDPEGATSSPDLQAEGLSVAVVRELVEAHGGTLEHQQREARPAEVRVRLPKGSAGAPEQFTDESTEALDVLHRLARPLPSEAGDWEDPSDPELVSISPDAPFVLVVAPNPDMRIWLRRLLRTRYGVATAREPESGLRRAQQYRPQLVVLDTGGQIGTEELLIQGLRRDPALCTTPVLALTPNPDVRVTAEVSLPGADDYLPKPFDGEELLARAGNLLRGRTQAQIIDQLQRRLDARIEDQLRELIRTGQLRRYLPQALLDGALRRAPPSDGAAERRWVTALYVGLHGLSEVAERMDPADLARLIDGYLRELSGLAVAHGGVVDQFFGDALLVIFGAPGAARAPEQARTALEAALAMRDRSRALASQWHRLGLPRALDARIGLHAGLALVGVLGSELGRRYTAVGGPVRLAAQLHAERSASEILISLTVYSHVKSFVKVGEPHPVVLEDGRRQDAFPVLEATTGAQDDPQ